MSLGYTHVIAQMNLFHQRLGVIEDTGSKVPGEMLEVFVRGVSNLIDSLKLFQSHSVWECVCENLPGNHKSSGDVYLRYAGSGNEAKPLLEGAAPFVIQGQYYYKPLLNRQEFLTRCSETRETGKIGSILPITTTPGASSVDLPIYGGDDNTPHWLLTLVFPQEQGEKDRAGEIFSIIEFIWGQMEVAWDSFLEKTTKSYLDKIDNALDSNPGVRHDSTLGQLQAVVRITANTFASHWGAIFLVDEQHNELKLTAANRAIDLDQVFPLGDSSQVIIQGASLVFAGRERIEEVFKTTGLKRIEEVFKTTGLKSLEKGLRNNATSYILFEQSVILPVGSKGVLAFFRARFEKGSQPPDRFHWSTLPFCQWQVYLLGRVGRHMNHLLSAHEAVQQRMRDMRNILAQVISPISETISSTGHGLPRNYKPGHGDLRKISDQLVYANALARVAAQYVQNFEKLLDIDTHNIELKKGKITDLRGYLIDFAKIFMPLIRPKCIHINITPETSNGIDLEVDTDLFHIAMSNIIDNAVKYSFTPEDRDMKGLQPKPAHKGDKENILVTATRKNDHVKIRVSNWGIPIKEEERDHIFERDFRGNLAHDRSKGTGIGLYLAREIIEMHGGSLMLKPGESPYNSVFEITMPRKMTIKQPLKINGEIPGLMNAVDKEEGEKDGWRGDNIP